MEQELLVAKKDCLPNCCCCTPAEQINGQQRDVILCAATKNHPSSDDVSDREIRALCLPEHAITNHVSDEDSDCVVLDGDTVLVTAGHHHPTGDLILAESTSSSPILAGSGIAQQAPEDEEEEDDEHNSVNNHQHHIASAKGNSGWRRVFAQAEDLITPVDDENAVGGEGESEAGVVGAVSAGGAVVVLEGEEEEVKKDILGQRKSGLSRCVATGNLADVAQETTSSSSSPTQRQQQQQKQREGSVENGNTCRDAVFCGGAAEVVERANEGREAVAGGERPQKNKRAKCGEEFNVNGDGDDVEQESRSCCCSRRTAILGAVATQTDSSTDCPSERETSERDAISKRIKGVQSERLDSSDSSNKLHDTTDPTTTSTASSFSATTTTTTNNNSSSSNSIGTTSSTSSAAAAVASSVIISRDVDNDDEPLFYSSAVNGSGGSSSQSTKSSLLATSSGGRSIISRPITSTSCNNSVVLTKQQTPTSVRTATSSATTGGPGSFGKSEQQLENPKNLSKRLHKLFRTAATMNCGHEGDNVDTDMHAEDNGVGDDDDADRSAKWSLSAADVATIVAIARREETSDGATATSSRASTAEETPSSSIIGGLRLVLQQRQQEEVAAAAVVAEGDAAVQEDEEVEQEMDTENAENNNNEVEGVGGAEEVVEGAASAPGLQQNPPPIQDFDVENAWADCEEVGDESEEICTCQNYSDTEDVYDEDEQLPSKDVDLSGFTSHDLLQESHAAENGGVASAATGTVVTTPLGPGRKRKISEAGSSSGMTSNMDSPCTSGQMYGNCLDVIQSKRCRGGKYGSGLGSPKTPTSSVGQIPAFLRTPRSAQSMHLMPRESLPVEMGMWLGQFQKWTEFDRVTALNHIIDLCEPSQVRHVMKVIEPQFQRDFISLLPRELALQVLSYLDPTDLLRAAQTCRNWRFLCDDNLLWKDKCKEGNIIIDVESDRPKRGRAGNMPPIASPWKAAYMRQQIIELNWRSRPIRPPKVLKGHDDHVITCLQFCGNRIVSGSDDNTLKVWSAVTGKCLRVLVGHTGGVWSSQMSSKYIISGSTDRTLKVWNAETGHCEHTLYGHTSTVRCMHLHGEKVVSGSRDATLRVWDVNGGTCLHVLVGHLAAVRCVQYDGKLVVSGAYDYTVKVWNPERQECLHTLQGHTNRVYSLQFDGIHVVSGSLDTSIRVWDAESGSCKHTLMGHQSLTSGMELRDHILVSGNADSTVRIWDIVSGQCLQTLSGPNKHQSAVTCLQFNSRFVITSSDDGTVKLWDVKTGEFIRNLVALDSGGSGGVVWRIRASDTKLICAVGSRNGTEETKLMVLDFDVLGACLKCS